MADGRRLTEGGGGAAASGPRQVDGLLPLHFPLVDVT